MPLACTAIPMRETVEIILADVSEVHDRLIAELLELPFDGFEECDECLKAFIPEQKWNTRTVSQLRGILNRLELPETWEETLIPDRNWTALWEDSIEPINVGRFRIRPTWGEAGDPDSDVLDLIIDPKMSFGTGYHESTRLVLRLLPNLIVGGEWVLDAGTGTGILAIAAAKLGAERIVGFDFDPWSIENAHENAVLNGVSKRTEFRLGSIEVITDDAYAVILANINRNALVSLLPEFDRRLRKHGILVMSGLLQSDREVILNALTEHGFEPVDEESEAEWWSVVSRSKA